MNENREEDRKPGVPPAGPVSQDRKDKRPKTDKPEADSPDMRDDTTAPTKHDDIPIEKKIRAI